MAAPFPSNPPNLNKNTEAVARAIWAQVQNGYTKQSGNLNGLNKLKIVKKRLVNQEYKPKPGMLAGLKRMFGRGNANAANEFSNALHAFPLRPNSVVKRVRNWVKKLPAKKSNASAAAVKKTENKIAANKQKRLQNLVRMLKLNNLIRIDHIGAIQKINNLRPRQMFINKRPLLRAITNQDIKNLREYFRQQTSRQKN
jgi:hypothetical protein